MLLFNVLDTRIFIKSYTLAGFDQRNTGFQTSGNNFDNDRQGLQNNLGTGRNVGAGFGDDQGTFNNQAGIGSGGGFGHSGQGQYESAGMTSGTRAPGLGGGQCKSLTCLCVEIHD